MKRMNRILAFLLCAIMLLGFLPTQALRASAATYSGTCGTNLTWTLDTSTGVLTISGSGAMTNYRDSSSMPWYSYQSSITSVKISNSVMTIGSYAFASCDSLTSVTIPDSVMTIGNYAFTYCALTSVTIPDSVNTICNGAFYYCRSLTSVSIGNSVTTIGDGAFAGCIRLTSVTIPDSVTTIGEHAFLNCGGLNISILNPDCSIYNGRSTLSGPEATTIYGYSGSTAQTYAEKYGYTFRVIMCDTHTLTYTAEVVPTCTMEGNIDYWCCSVCNLYFSDAEATQEIDFEQTILPLTEHYFDANGKCTVCGYARQIIIEMTDSYGDGWNGNKILVYEDAVLLGELTILDGATATESFNYHDGKTYHFVWLEGSYADECSFRITKDSDLLYECTDASKLCSEETFYAICLHSWKEATCQSPMTCEKCNTKSGDRIPHSYNAVGECTVCGCLGQITIEMTDSEASSWWMDIVQVYENDKLTKELVFSKRNTVTEYIDYYEDTVYRFEWHSTQMSEGMINAENCKIKIILKEEVLFECNDASQLKNGSTFLLLCKHDWTEATCQTAKTCKKCATVEGKPLPHSYGPDNICTACARPPQFVIQMGDEYGDGWTGCAILVYEDDELIRTLTIEDGSKLTEYVDYHESSTYLFVWSEGDCSWECSFTIEKEWETLFDSSDVIPPSDGEIFLTVAALEDAQPEVDHTLKFNMNISAGAEMVVNYNFMASLVSEYEDFYLEIKKDVAGGEPIVTTYGISEGHTAIGSMNNPITGEAILYNAAYTGINAKEMGDEFATTLYAIDANGKIYKGETVVSSIKDFLLGKLNDESSIPEMKTMAVDILKYGAAAQINFNYDVENLVTDALTEDQLALGTQKTPEALNYASTTGSGANVNTNITVKSKVELALSCIAAGQANPAGVKCVIIDADGNVLAELATVNTAGVMYSATYSNVGAKEMRNVISATFVNENGAAISKTVNWSVESYVAQTRAKSTATANEIAVVNAMLVYGDAVAAYMAAK